MQNTAVVTGAGSGVGQAVAWALAEQGWRVALVGRRAETLQQTAERASAWRDKILILPCDLSDGPAVERLGEEVQGQLGAIDVLVNAAGINVPDRSFENLALADYHQIIDTNLNGAYYCTQAFLPGMRARGSGTIIHIVSDAGKMASPKAGPAYVMSKFGLTGLTQAINAEERGRGIRACAIFPGDIDTPLLDRRPVPPSADARTRMLRAEDVAECVLLVIRLPAHVIVEELVVRPR